MTRVFARCHCWSFNQTHLRRFNLITLWRNRLDECKKNPHRYQNAVKNNKWCSEMGWKEEPIHCSMMKKENKIKSALASISFTSSPARLKYVELFLIWLFGFSQSVLRPWHGRGHPLPQHKAKPADGAQVQCSTVQICPSMPMRMRLARVCFLRLWIILLLWWRAHPCLILPDPLRLCWHSPFSWRLQRPHVVKGARKLRSKVWEGREHCMFLHLLSTRPLLISPDSLRVTVLDTRRASATCLQRLWNIIKGRTEFCSSRFSSQCQKASRSCEKLNSVSLVSFRRAASWAAPHFQ